MGKTPPIGCFLGPNRCPRELLFFQLIPLVDYLRVCAVYGLYIKLWG